MTQLFKLKKKNIYFKSGKDFEASFTYIKDVCFALDRLIKYRKFTNPVFHLGSGKNYKLSEVSKILSKTIKTKTFIWAKVFNHGLQTV